MKVVGVAVHMTTKGRPAARCVVVEGTYANRQVVEEFELTSAPNLDIATQLRDLAGGLNSRLAGLKPDRLVVRTADFARATTKEGPRLRLMAEGALASAARELVGVVVVANGKALAERAHEPSKAALDALGAAASTEAPEATAAAFAGLV